MKTFSIEKRDNYSASFIEKKEGPPLKLVLKFKSKKKTEQE